MVINKNSPLWQMKLLCILSLSFCLTACISRLSRPEMTGQILNSDGLALADVKVGETQTDAQGQFKLKERRYHAFLLTELLIMEAPPLRVGTLVAKSGYQSCLLRMFSSYGGGQRKGAK